MAAQQIDRKPTPNIGFAFYDRLRSFQGHIAERFSHWKEVGFRNAMKEQMGRIQSKRPDLTAEFIAHAREYGQKFFPELQREGPEHEQEHDYER